jgi:endonuclease/exonuclease/phosphatase family metal-dependent hydrolase
MPKSLFRKLTKKFFIISNIVLAVLFLLGCYAYLFNPKNWWFLGLLTLGAFYLLLLLILFIVFWLFVKPKWVLISLVTFVLAYKPLSNIIPFRFSSTFDKQKPKNGLRMLTWNVEHFDILEHKTHPERKEEMFNIITEYQPDIACFQEMVGGDKSKEAINYVPDMLSRLDFVDYNYSYNPKLDFDGNHHFGIITFSKYPMINKQTVSFYPYDYNSIFQYTDIVKGMDTIRVFNIHLQSLKFSQSNLQYIEKPTVNDETDIQRSKSVISKLKQGFLKRQVQAERIKEEVEKSPYPVIICGDFNDVPNSYAYNCIGKGLNNAFAEKGSGMGRTFSGISPTLRIDNIFADKKFKVLQYTRIAKKLSDHFPVFADMEKRQD